MPLKAVDKSCIVDWITRSEQLIHKLSTAYREPIQMLLDKKS